MSMENKIKLLKKGDELTSEQKRNLISYAKDKGYIDTAKKIGGALLKSFFS